MTFAWIPKKRIMIILQNNGETVDVDNETNMLAHTRPAFRSRVATFVTWTPAEEFRERILDAFQKEGLLARVARLQSREATTEELLMVHPMRHLARVEAAAGPLENGEDEKAELEPRSCGACP